jgi:hypothetical protein
MAQSAAQIKATLDNHSAECRRFSVQLQDVFDSVEVWEVQISTLRPRISSAYDKLELVRRRTVRDPEAAIEKTERYVQSGVDSLRAEFTEEVHERESVMKLLQIELWKIQDRVNDFVRRRAPLLQKMVQEHASELAASQKANDECAGLIERLEP